MAVRESYAAAMYQNHEMMNELEDLPTGSKEYSVFNDVSSSGTKYAIAGDATKIEQSTYETPTVEEGWGFGEDPDGASSRRSKESRTTTWSEGSETSRRKFQSDPPAPIVLWLRQIKIPDGVVEKIKLMGLSLPTDLLMFTEDELHTVYEISQDVVQRMRQAVKEHEATKTTSNGTKVHSKLPQMRKCKAVYSFKAVQETHLNAAVNEVFRIVNSSFPWWLCRNTNGETGLLPSNHLKEINASEQAEAATAAATAGTTSDEDTDGPKWLLRARIRQICEDALLSDNQNDNFITYNAVKTKLIDEFGEELYKQNCEHVKEQIRRAEEQHRLAHNEKSRAAAKAIKEAFRHRYRSSVKAKKKAAKRAAKAAKNISRKGCTEAGEDVDADDSNDSDNDDNNDGSNPQSSLRSRKGEGEKMVKYLQQVGERGFEHLPQVPALPPRNTVKNGEPADARSRTVAAMLASAPAQQTNSNPQNPKRNWTGGLFSKKGDPSKSLGISLSSSTRQRYFIPSSSGLIYYTDASQSEMKGEIPIDSSTKIEYPLARPKTILIRPDASRRTFDLTASTEENFLGMREYLRRRLMLPDIISGVSVEPTKSLAIGFFAKSTVAKWREKTVVKKLLKLKLPKNFTAQELQSHLFELSPRGNHIALILACGLEGGQAFLIQEFAERYSLKRCLFSGKELSWAKRTSFMISVYQGLHFLHTRYQLPHLRFNSNNAVLTESGTLKITDFGLCRIPRAGEDSAFASTNVHQDISRCNYICCAPECWTTVSPTLKADVFSLAMVLLEIVSQKPASTHLKAAVTIKEYHEFQLRPTVDSCCSKELDSLIRSCWDSSPDLRPRLADIPSLCPSVFKDALKN